MLKIKITDPITNEYFEFFDNSNGCILNNFEGFEFSDIKSVVDDVPGVIGAAFVASGNGKRPFMFGGEFVGSNALSDRRAMLLPMRKNGHLKLVEFTTYDHLDLQCEADITKITSPYQNALKAFQIQLVAPDFRFYSQTLHEDSMEESQILGGTPIPTPVPIDFSGSEETGGKIFNNAGNDSAPVVFTIHGPGNGFTVRNDTLQQQFRINYELELGDEVVIDTKNRTVTLNGIYNIYSALEGYFWELEPGDNLIYFVADSDADENTLLDLEWRDAYNGV